MTSKKQSILIAEDNPANLEIFSEFLTGLDYEVQRTADGKSALEIALNFEPDLILLDIHLPEMDGYEVCKRCKQNERTKDIPIIFVSALFEPYNKVKAFECGGVDYLTKPVQMEELGARIRMHLALHGKILELEKFNRIMLDREMRIVELKKEVNALTSELGRPTPYPEIWNE